MNEFYIYFQLGLHHVLDLHAYDHLLFLVALMAPFLFKDWKKVLILITLFTVGHTFALFLSVFNIIFVKSTVIEFLIPITIVLSSTYNILAIKKTSKNNNLTIIDFLTLFFGLIHGLGFSNYIKNILGGSAVSKILPLTEFAIGIEAAQLIVVVAILTLAAIFQVLFKTSKRDWILVLSSIIIGIVLPMIFQNKIIQ